MKSKVKVSVREIKGIAKFCRTMKDSETFEILIKSDNSHFIIDRGTE